MKRLAWVGSALLLCAGCAPGLAGQWKGSGEVGDGHFFQFAIDNRDEAARSATFQYAGAEPAKLPVCAYKEVEKAVEFKLDLDGRAATCADVRAPYLFSGEMGQHVITGLVLDPGGKKVGMFRAFRVEE